jgi:hypothetical protein
MPALIPAVLAPAQPLRHSNELEEADYDDKENRKYCHECGRKIRSRAEICPKCGVRQPDQAGASRKDKLRDGIKVPVLISAISNIVVGMIWAVTCFGVVFTIPMVILCIFEFGLWSKADSLSLRRLGDEA